MRPDTTFGCIRLGAEHEDGSSHIERFVDKPALELAWQYAELGAYWWNKSVFVVRPSVWLDLVKRPQPATADAGLAA